MKLMIQGPSAKTWKIVRRHSKRKEVCGSVIGSEGSKVILLLFCSTVLVL
jgi:hypothetical protein